MGKELTVSREDLYSVYKEVKAALVKLEAIMSEVGCLHIDAYNVTTFTDHGRRYYCPDCGETYTEEVEINELEL